jgi:hypothetical protein
MGDELINKLSLVGVTIGSIILASFLSGVISLSQGIRIHGEFGSTFLLYWVVMLGVYLLLRLIYLFMQYVRGDF